MPFANQCAASNTEIHDVCFIAEQFLQREIKNYENRLVEAERRLKEFKTKNIDLLSEKGSYYDRLKAARDQLAAAKEQLQLSSKRKDELSEQLGGRIKLLRPMGVLWHYVSAHLGAMAEDGRARDWVSSG